MEEDTFKLRVNKIFGNLSSSSSNSSSGLNPLWSLTDDEIEKIEWGLDKSSSPEPEEESKPYPSNLDGFFSKQREEVKQRGRRDAVDDDDDESKKMASFSSEIEEDLNDLDDDCGGGGDGDGGGGGVVLGLAKRCKKPEDCDEDEWEIRSSIGLDCTLDYEEEEDEYDKVAVGRQKAGDRVFMKECIESGICSDSYTGLPVSFSEVVRDTRANHNAAKLRLKEDTDTAGGFDSLTVSDKVQREVTEAAQGTSTEVVKPKSILMRKQNDSDVKPQKRVRFDPECKNNLEEGELSKEPLSVTKDAFLFADDHPQVPDYVRNPSKYTCYTFDSSSSEVDEEANRRAYMDFFNLLRKKSNGTEAQTENISLELPKSVTFTPRKKSEDVATNNRNDKDSKEANQRKVVPVSITAGNDDVEDGQVSAMDEDADADEPKTMIENSISLRKSGRRYRLKVGHEMDDSTE